MRTTVSYALDTAPDASRRFAHVYRGTDGDDDFVGTNKADKWISGDAGYDGFDGLGGVDRAVIDYSRREYSEFFISRGSSEHSYAIGGSDEYGDGGSNVHADNVEQIFLDGGASEESYILYDLPATAPGMQLRIDGGGGADFLVIQMGDDDTAEMRLVVDQDGHASGTLGDFYRFGSYNVYAGRATTCWPAAPATTIWKAGWATTSSGAAPPATSSTARKARTC